MATKRIKDITNTATTFASDDFIALDGTSQGTRKMDKDDLISQVSAGVSGDYLEEANNLSDVASLDTSKLNMEIPDVGTAPNEVPLNGQLGSMAYQSSDSVAMGTAEADQISIGTSSPSSVADGGADELVIGDATGSAVGMTVASSTSGKGRINFSDGAGTDAYRGQLSYSHSSDSLSIVPAGSTRATIDSAGNTGFGQPSPSTKVDVNGVLTIDTDYAPSSAVGGLALGDYQGGGYKWIQSMNSQPLVINPLGNKVGIGSAPGSYNSNANNLVVGSGSGSEGLTIASGTTGEGGIYFADGTTGNEQYRGYAVYQHTQDRLVFGSGGNNRWYIDSSGDLKAWSSGTINVGSGGGIDFGSGASTTISDYEEGTWSPAYATETVNMTTPPTMDIIHARYVRVGGLVHLEAYIRTDSVDTTGGSGNLIITGLPFAPHSSSYSSVDICFATHWGTNYPLAGYTYPGIGITLQKRTAANGEATSMSASDLTNGATANQNRLIFKATYYTTA